MNYMNVYKAHRVIYVVIGQKASPFLPALCDIMKAVVVMSCLLAATSIIAAPTTPEETARRRSLPAVEHEEVHDEFGQYALRYVTAEGTIVSERGRLVPTADGHAYVLVVDGETSYIGDDGKIYVTKYSAGLNGTKMEGTHLPVPVVDNSK